MLNRLLSDVLPELSPHLFPFRRDLSWLRESAFRHPAASALEAETVQVAAETTRRLEALDQKIQEVERADEYLRDLLTTAGDRLKDAVKQVLEELLAAATVADARILDVDADASLRAERNKREDLRIEWGDEAILINVAGRDRFVTPTSLNQMARHHRFHLKAWGQAVEKVHSLLIANFNYAGGVDPRNRGEMFGSGTAEARERLSAEGHGVISTFDLFRLVRGIQRREIAITPNDLRRLLTTEGILDGAAFLASLAGPPTE